MKTRRFFNVRTTSRWLGRFLAISAEEAVDAAVEHHAIAHGSDIRHSACIATVERS